MPQERSRKSAPVRLRVLILDASSADLAGLVAELGHEPLAAELASAWEELRPDVALVCRGDNDERTLDAISRIAHTTACPVIALVPRRDDVYVHEAARQGAFGCVVDSNADALAAAMEIALARSAEYRRLQEAFARRAIVEQAKGILMARNRIGPDEAFELLRNHARNHSRKVVEVAEAVVESHDLLSEELQSVD